MTQNCTSLAQLWLIQATSRSCRDTVTNSTRKVSVFFRVVRDLEQGEVKLTFFKCARLCWVPCRQHWQWSHHVEGACTDAAPGIWRGTVSFYLRGNCVPSKENNCPARGYWIHGVRNETQVFLTLRPGLFPPWLCHPLDTDRPCRGTVPKIQACGKKLRKSKRLKNNRLLKPCSPSHPILSTNKVGAAAQGGNSVRPSPATELGPELGSLDSEPCAPSTDFSPDQSTDVIEQESSTSSLGPALLRALAECWGSKCSHLVMAQGSHLKVPQPLAEYKGMKRARAKPPRFKPVGQ